MVWLIRSGILITLLCCVAALCVVPRNSAGQEPQAGRKDQMFSGTVTAVDETSLTAVRNGPGKATAAKTFAITPQTRFEGGTPKVDSRVTVRYVTTDEGDMAVHVIVRGPAKK
jgi:hypothetical protein